MGESPAKKKQQEKVAGAEDATVADFAERFFKDIQSRDRKDVTMPRRYLEKDILPHIGSKPVRDITAEDMRSVIWRKKNKLRCRRRPGARPAQAHVRLCADLRPDPGQPGHGPADAARLPRRRPRPGADA